MTEGYCGSFCTTQLGLIDVTEGQTQHRYQIWELVATSSNGQQIQ